MLIKGALVYTEDHIFEKRDLWVSGERIVPGPAAGDVIDAEGLFALPGLVDIHLHGAAGRDFCDADPEALRAIAEYEAAHGVTAVCPAAMTLGEAQLGEILEAAAAAQVPEAAGFRLEGPFLNPRKAGAQDPQYIRSGGEGGREGIALFRRLQEKSGGRIRILDIAPEEEGNTDMIRALSQEVRISIGHTAADCGTAAAAFRAGAKQLTHLYNAMPVIHHREPGPVIAALENGASAEIIADGVHVHPAMVRLAFRLFGPERIILISDSMRACGMPEGDYELGGQPVTVKRRPGGELAAVLTDHPETLAGSVTNLYDCMRRAVTEMGIPLEDAVRAAAENPAEALGIADQQGSLKAGCLANIILADRDLSIREIILRGQRRNL